MTRLALYPNLSQIGILSYNFLAYPILKATVNWTRLVCTSQLNVFAVQTYEPHLIRTLLAICVWLKGSNRCILPTSRVTSRTTLASRRSVTGIRPSWPVRASGSGGSTSRPSMTSSAASPAMLWRRREAGVTQLRSSTRSWRSSDEYNPKNWQACLNHDDQERCFEACGCTFIRHKSSGAIYETRYQPSHKQILTSALWWHTVNKEQLATSVLSYSSILKW